MLKEKKTLSALSAQTCNWIMLHSDRCLQAPTISIQLYEALEQKGHLEIQEQLGSQDQPANQPIKNILQKLGINVWFSFLQFDM